MKNSTQKSLTLILLVFFLMCMQLGSAQDLQWINGYTSGLGGALSTKVDGSGNVYFAGGFAGTVDFDPGPGTTNLTSAGSFDIYISKLDASGNLLWAHRIGGTNNDGVGTLELDASGNVYVTGWFQESNIDFNPGAGTNNLTSVGGTDVYVLKLNSSGAFQWVYQGGGSSPDEGHGLVIDGSGNVYVAGDTNGGDFDNTAGTTTLGGNGLADVFVVQLNSSGVFQWGVDVGGTGRDEVNDLELESSGDLFVGGIFSNTVDFDPSGSVANQTSNGLLDAFLLQLTNTGEYQEVITWGGTSNDGLNDLVFTSTGSVVATSYFDGTIDVDPYAGTKSITAGSSNVDQLVQHFDIQNDEVLWFKQIDITSAGLFGIDVDANDRIYHAGFYSLFGIVEIYDVDGIDEFSIPATFGMKAYGTTVDGSNLYVHGAFTSNVNFDLCGGTNNVNGLSGDKAFVARYAIESLADQPTLTATNTSIFPTESTTISIQSGNLNSATNWEWYAGSCGGTPVGSGTSINVSPTTSTTYFVRGEGYSCITEGSCSSITITVEDPFLTYGSYFDLSDGSIYSGNSFDFSTQSTSVRSITFSADGSKMFLMAGDRNIYQYSLSIAFDLGSTVTHDGSPFSTGMNEPRQLAFTPDGTTMHIVDNKLNQVTQFSLTTPFDITSGVTSDGSRSVQAQTGSDSAWGIEFNSDGSKMFISGIVDDLLHQYTLESPYDVTSSVTYDNVTFDPTNELLNPTYLTFNPEGTLLYVSNYQYSLATPYDLSSGVTPVGPIVLTNNQNTNIHGVHFSDDGTKLYLGSDFDDSVHEYLINTGGFVETEENDGSLDGSLLVSITGDTFTSAGSTLTPTTDYNISNLPSGLNSILTVAANGLSASLTLTGSAVPHQDADDLAGLDFTFENSAFTNSAASAVVDAVGFNTNEGIDYDDNDPVLVYDYAYNPDNFAFDGVRSVSAQEGSPSGVTFNDDGTKIYIVGTSNDQVFQYSLTNPFDVTTGVTLDGNSVSLNPQDDSPVGLTFNDDGTSLFVAGAASQTVLEYTLTSPYDVTTGFSFSGTSLDVSGTGSPSDLAFSENGMKLFIISATADQVSQYALTTAFDISSGLTVDGSYSVLDQENTANGIAFSESGTKMIIMGASTQASEKYVHNYHLANPYDITNGVTPYQNPVNVRTFEVGPSDIAFSNNGDRMFVVGYLGDEINQFDMQVGNLVESASDDGSITGSYTLQIYDELFANAGGTLTQGADYSISNLPVGLSSSLAVAADAKTAVLTISGTATSHDKANEVESLSFTFENSAFSIGDVSLVANATSASSELAITFIEAPSISDQTFSVAENSANGTLVGTVTASGEGTLTYSITAGNNLGGFAIDTNSGEITVADHTDMDFETNPSFTLTVEVSDGVLSSTATITIDLTDLNDTPPVPTAFSPLDEATDVLASSNLVITFGEDVVSTGSTTFARIKRKSDDVILQSPAIHDPAVTTFSGNTMTINPASDMPEDVEVYIEIPDGAIEDLAGNEYLGFTDNETWNFTVADNTPPTISDFNPVNDATMVSNTAAITLTFSEDMQLTGHPNSNINIKRVSNNATLHSIDPVSAQVTITDNVVTIQPTGGILSASEVAEVYVNWSTTPLEDLAGNDFNSLFSTSDYRFTVNNDITLPSPTLFSPLDEATNVSLSANLVVTFDEPVQSTGATRFARIRRKSDDVILQSAGIHDPAVTTFFGNQMTINPASDLPEDLEVYIEIPDGAIEDMVGNVYLGFSDNETWDFTTPDITAPTLTNLDPLDGATGVGNHASIVMTFSEEMQLTGHPNSNINIKRVSNNATLHSIDPASAQVTISNNVVTIQPIGGILATSEEAEIYVNWSTTPFEDLAGNDFNDLFSTTDYRFTVFNFVAPTDLTINSSTIGENNAVNAEVGSLSTTDADVGETYLYSLVAGAGDADNSSFNISGVQLRATDVFDFETKNSYSIRVQTDDQNGGTFSKQVTININDVSEVPTDLTLSSTDIDESSPVGSTIGNLNTMDEDNGETYTYTLVSGTGDTDNASFSISGNELQSAEIFDFETKTSYSVRIETNDGNGGLLEKSFAISINNLPPGLTGVGVTSSSIDENLGIGSDVGDLFALGDEIEGVSFTFSLVAGSGDTDNSAFAVASGQLQSATTFDFEVKNQYSIRVLADDGAGSTIEQIMLVDINDVNEAPTDIALSNSSVPENSPFGTLIGTFSASDEDAGQLLSFQFSSNPATDNTFFAIENGNELVTKVLMHDYEIQDLFLIEVEVSDGQGGQYEETLSISITDQNDDPTALTLNTSVIDENNAINAVVGAFSTSDQDTGDSFTYSLVSGMGDTGNASFSIAANQLQAGSAFDFELKNSYSIRVQTNDGNGGLLENSFTISVNDVNEDPTDIALSNASIEESNPVGSLVGVLSSTDEDASQTFTYSLVAGAGDTDNASFTISGEELLSEEVFDFETKSSYAVRVQTTDGNGGTYEESFSISIADLPASITSFTLSNNAIDENLSSGSVIGSFSTSGEDLSGSFTYSLVSGSGDDDNTSFSVSGDQLLTASIFDFETKSSYSIRVMTDDGGQTEEQVFTISINDVSEAPIALLLSASAIDENNSVNAVIGSFSTTDEDTGETHTYSLVGGSGDDDNTSFAIVGDELQANEAFDFETKSSYSIRVETNDGNGGTLQQTFSISINDLDENTAPVLTSPLVDVTFDNGFTLGTINFATAFTDADNDQITLSGASSDEGVATVDFSGTTLNMHEVGTGTTTITVTADDGNGGVTTAEFELTVNFVAQAPPTAIALSNTSADENSAVSTLVGQLSATDANVYDEIVYSLVAGTGDDDNSSFAISGFSLRTSTMLDFDTNPTLSIRVQADDQNGGTFEQVFTITVNDLGDNEAPLVATSLSDLSEVEGFGSAQIDLTNTFTDSDDDDLTITASSSDESVVTIQVLSSNEIQINEVGIGVSTITVTADDGNGGTVSDAFTYTVTEKMNSAPIVVNPISDKFRAEGSSQSQFSYADTFSDPDGDELTVTVSSSDETVATLEVVLNEQITVTIGSVGISTITLTADDGNGGTVSDIFTYEVTEAPNNAPTVVNPFANASSEEGFVTSQISYAGVFEDLDGEDLIITVSSSEETVVTAEIIAGEQIQINEVGIGISTITVTADDGNGGIVSDTFTYEVTEAPNNAPTVVNPFADVSSEEGFVTSQISYAGVFEDLDGDDLIITVSSSEETVVTAEIIAGNQIQLNEFGIGTSTITVAADDGNGGMVSDSFDFTVNEVLEVGTDITVFSIPEQTGPATIDVDSHTVVVEVVFGTDVTSLSPTIEVSNGASVTPSGAQDFSSVVTYTVIAEDGSTTQDWTVTVTEALSNETDILELTDPDQKEAAIIDLVNHTISIIIQPSSDLISFRPTLVLSEGATYTSTEFGNLEQPITFTVTAADGITMQDWIVTVTVDFTGTNSLEDEIEATVYPNPALDFLKIKSNSKLEVRLTTSDGRVLLKTNGADLSLDLRSLGSGMYILILSDGNSIAYKRIVKAN